MGIAYAAKIGASTETSAPGAGSNDWYPDGYTAPWNDSDGEQTGYAPGWSGNQSGGDIGGEWPPEWPAPDSPDGTPPIPASKEDQITDKYLWLVYPAGLYGIPSGVDFSFGVQFTEGDDYDLYDHTGTVTFEMIDGDGTLAFTDDDNTLSFTASFLEFLSGVTYTMDDSTADYEDFTVRISTTVDGETIYDVRTFRAYGPYVKVEVVDVDGNDLTVSDMTADDDTLDWTIYLKLTAMNADGSENEDFASAVKLYGYIDYISQWTDGLTTKLLGYDENAIYDSSTATEFSLTVAVDYLSIPATAFTGGDPGQASVKVTATRTKAAQNPGAPYDDNTGYLDLLFVAKQEAIA